MENAFIDESGVTGYTKRSSKYFNITAVLLNDLETARKKFKKFFRKLFIKNKKRPHYFHASKEERKDILNLIEVVKQLDLKVICYICKKKEGFDYKIKMSDFVIKLPIECKNVIISKYDTRKSVQDFIIGQNRKRKVTFQINQDNVLLQIADLFSWAIYRFYEFNDSEYFNLLKDKIEIKQNP